MPGVKAPQSPPRPKVVRRLPVYMNGTAPNPLILLQFPEKRASATLPFGELRYRSVYQQIELDVPLDTDAPQYSHSKATALLQHGPRRSGGPPPNAAGDEAAPADAANDEAAEQTLEQQTFVSSALMKNANYQVAIVRQGEVHMVPLSYAVQMRAALAYLNPPRPAQGPAAGRRDGSPPRPRAGGAPGAAASDEAAARGRAVQVKIRSKAEIGRDEVIRSEREQLERLVEEDQWQALEIAAPAAALDALMPTTWAGPHRQPVAPLQARAAYLATLLPPPPRGAPAQVSPTGDGAGAPAAPVLRRDVPLYEIVAQPLRLRLASLLVNCHVVEFGRLVTLLNLKAELPGNIVRALLECAVPLQDRWVVRSALLYTGRVLHARDYLLALFARAPRVSRAAFSRAVPLPVEQAASLLGELAQFEAGPPPTWALKGDPDSSLKALLAPLELTAVTRAEGEVRSWADAARRRFEAASGLGTRRGSSSGDASRV